MSSTFEVKETEAMQVLKQIIVGLKKITGKEDLKVRYKSPHSMEVNLKLTPEQYKEFVHWLETQGYTLNNWYVSLSDYSEDGYEKYYIIDDYRKVGSNGEFANKEVDVEYYYVIDHGKKYYLIKGVTFYNDITV